jgi:hypothetical protein
MRVKLCVQLRECVVLAAHLKVATFPGRCRRSIMPQHGAPALVGQGTNAVFFGKQLNDNEGKAARSSVVVQSSSNRCTLGAEQIEEGLHASLVERLASLD